MIRIAFVIPTLDQSGAERQLSLLAEGLPRDRYEISVFALNRGGPYADRLRAQGISVTVLQKRFRFDPLTWLRLRRALHQLQPDVVQSFLFSANSYIRLPGVCPQRSRIVVSERCVDSWKSTWQLQLDRRLLSRTHAMTANSASVAEFYQSVGVPASLITVIPNGIPLVSEPPDRSYLRRELGFSENERIVGYVGRLARQKRLEDVIWAFQLLRQVVDSCRLVLIGDGPERDALALLAQKLDCRGQMVFAGHREDAYRLMQGLDAICLASEFEGMSNSLMEAMSLGIPAVVSDIAPNRELIQHEQTGLLFPVGKAPELTRSLQRILNDSASAQSMASAARQYLQEFHSVEKMVASHCRLYERVLNQPANAAVPAS